MIVVNRYEIVRTEKGYIKSFDKDFRNKLKFENDNPPVKNVFSVEEWRVYLSDLRVNGFKLKRKSLLGNPIRYHVFFFGSPKKLVKTLKGSRGAIFNLFPGYDKDMKPREIAKEGFLL